MARTVSVSLTLADVLGPGVLPRNLPHSEVRLTFISLPRKSVGSYEELDDAFLRILRPHGSWANGIEATSGSFASTRPQQLAIEWAASFAVNEAKLAKGRAMYAGSPDLSDPDLPEQPSSFRSLDPFDFDYPTPDDIVPITALQEHDRAYGLASGHAAFDPHVMKICSVLYEANLFAVQTSPLRLTSAVQLGAANVPATVSALTDGSSAAVASLTVAGIFVTYVAVPALRGLGTGLEISFREWGLRLRPKDRPGTPAGSDEGLDDA